MTRPAFTHANAARALLSLLVVSLLAGLLVPVYTDEVAWRLQLSRWFQDGGIDYATGETCGLNSHAVAPWTMLPVRWFSALVTMVADTPAWVRIAGVAFAILALFGMRGAVRRAGGEGQGELLLVALLGLGVLPFLLVWSRPEQPVLLAMIAALLLGMRRGDMPWRAAAVALLFGIAIAYHLKALFYLPVFALAVVFTARGWPRRFALAALVVLAAVAYRYWTDRFACPDDPVLAAKIRGENASALLVGGDWRALWNALPTLAQAALPVKYVTVALPAPGYMSSWLPGVTLPFPVLAGWFAGGAAGWLLGIAIGVAALILAVVRRDWSPPVLFALALAAGATGWATLQLNKNSYESALYLPALALAAALSLGQVRRRWLDDAVWGVALLSVASQALLLGHYVPKLWDRLGSGYLADQPYSLNAYRYPRSRVVVAGAQCGIRPGMPRVLLDDMTYFAFREGRQPMHRLGVLSGWNGSLDDPLGWLQAKRSPGAVIACAYLPPDMRAIAIATGDICCVKTPNQPATR